MLQSNSCNYVQSVDNQGLAERLLAHKHSIRKDSSKATDGGKDKKKGFESACEKLTIKELLCEAVADVHSNKSR